MADTYLAYIDEAVDPEQDACVFSAILIPTHEWHAVFDALKQLRRELETSDRLYPTLEWHARDFVTGRGRVSPEAHPVHKHRRAEIFRKILHWIAEMPCISVVNSLYPQRVGDQDQLIPAYEALVTGINRTMRARDAFAFLLADEGHEKEYRNAVRRLAEQGGIERIVEDAFFKQSAQSYFIQLADFCGYALLRREHPTPIIRRYGSDAAFGLLGDALVTTELDIGDPEGIIRPGAF